MFCSKKTCCLVKFVLCNHYLSCNMFIISELWYLSSTNENLIYFKKLMQKIHNSVYI